MGAKFASFLYGLPTCTNPESSSVSFAEGAVGARHVLDVAGDGIIVRDATSGLSAFVEEGSVTLQCHVKSVFLFKFTAFGQVRETLVPLRAVREMLQDHMTQPEFLVTTHVFLKQEAEGFSDMPGFAMNRFLHLRTVEAPQASCKSRTSWGTLSRVTMHLRRLNMNGSGPMDPLPVWVVAPGNSKPGEHPVLEIAALGPPGPRSLFDILCSFLGGVGFNEAWATEFRAVAQDDLGATTFVKMHGTGVYQFLPGVYDDLDSMLDSELTTSCPKYGVYDESAAADDAVWSSKGLASFPMCLYPQKVVTNYGSERTLFVTRRHLAAGTLTPTMDLVAVDEVTRACEAATRHPLGNMWGHTSFVCVSNYQREATIRPPVGTLVRAHTVLVTVKDDAADRVAHLVRTLVTAPIGNDPLATTVQTALEAAPDNLADYSSWVMQEATKQNAPRALQVLLQYRDPARPCVFVAADTTDSVSVGRLAGAGLEEALDVLLAWVGPRGEVVDRSAWNGKFETFLGRSISEETKTSIRAKLAV